MYYNNISCIDQKVQAKQVCRDVQTDRDTDRPKNYTSPINGKLGHKNLFNKLFINELCNFYSLYLTNSK